MKVVSLVIDHIKDDSETSKTHLGFCMRKYEHEHDIEYMCTQMDSALYSRITNRAKKNQRISRKKPHCCWLGLQKTSKKNPIFYNCRFGKQSKFYWYLKSCEHTAAAATATHSIQKYSPQSEINCHHTKQSDIV